VGGGSAHVARSAGGLPRATFVRVPGDAPGLSKVLGLQPAKSTPAIATQRAAKKNGATREDRAVRNHCV